MPDQTDTPPTTPPATKRMTTAEVAALVQQLDGRLEDLGAVVTEQEQRLREVGGGASGWLTRDQLSERVNEALAPLHDEVHQLSAAVKAIESPSGSDTEAGLPAKLTGILARLEEAERKAAAVDPGALTERVVTELHPTLADLRKRVSAAEQSSGVVVDPEGLNALGRRVASVEAAVKAFEADPVSHTLAEDALADQVQGAVERALTDLSTTSDVSRARVDQLARDFADLRQHVETHGTHVTRAIVNEVAAELSSDFVAPTSVATGPNRGGLGAARKVLQLMRAVTHIGKERQADMGQAGKFKFRGIDEAMDAVGHAMRDVGLILSPEVLKDETSQNTVTKQGTNRNGGTYESSIIWTTTKLTMRYTFVDPEDGSIHPIEMVGEGRDASDKSTSKAGSMAFKYALLQALCIPVNGLDDSDASPPQVMEQERAEYRPTSQPSANTNQHADEQARARRAGEALSAIRNVYRVPGGPQAQYNRLVQIMHQIQSEGLLEFPVEGSTLNQHGEATLRTLQAPPPDDARASTEPPMNDEGAGEYY